LKLYPLKVSNIIRQTDDCVQIIFDPGDQKAQFFPFIQGQYLTLETQLGEELVRRSYSLCSSPDEEVLTVAVKEIPEGKFSGFANQKLEEGAVLNALPPMGQFLKDPNTIKNQNLLCIAAGSGITPILSIIKAQLEQSEDANCTLLYLNKTSKSVIFKEELSDLKNQYIGRFQILHFFTREAQDAPLFNGRIDREKLELIFKAVLDLNNFSHYFLCGPKTMIETTNEFLLENKVTQKQIHFELFFADAEPTNKDDKPIAVGLKDGSVHLEIIQNGKRHFIEMGAGSPNVLEVASASGLDLPYACKGGVCCTCKAKVVEGEAKMYVNYALENEEVEQGYILTCQAYPVTEKLVVNYDEAL